MTDITLVLDAINRGESKAADELLPLVYESLRKLAAARMAREAGGHTLQATALVHEAWLQLVNESGRDWKNRSYFFAAAAEAMRRILVENARRKSRLKRGGGQQRLNIEDVELAIADPDDKILLVNDALQNMERTHPKHASVVVMKFFGGMTNKEVAEILGVTERSVDRYWLCAKLWLFNELQAAEK
jgi:RNA polymerase sigma factor (TIGR02999 family)